MASLFTCHLGFCLGWQAISLNLAKYLRRLRNTHLRPLHHLDVRTGEGIVHDNEVAPEPVNSDHITSVDERPYQFVGAGLVERALDDLENVGDCLC